MNVALFEFPDEVDWFLADCQTRGVSPEGFTIVSLWPDVHVALRRRALPYVDTLPYFTNDSHARVVLTSEEWLSVAEASLRLEDGSGITESYNTVFVFYFRFFINYFLWVLQILDGVVERHRIESLTVCAARRDGPIEKSEKLEVSDRPLAGIVKAFASQRNIQVHEVPVAHGSVNKNRGRRGSRRLVETGMALINACHRLRVRRCGPDSVLITSLGYNMDRLVRSLKQRFPLTKCILIPNKGFGLMRSAYRLVSNRPADGFVMVDGKLRGERARCLAANMDTALASVQGLMTGAWKQRFVHHGVPFLEIFQRKITEGLFPYITDLASRTAVLEAVLEETKPRLVVSPHSVGVDAVLGELSTKRGIPSLSISHGTFVPPSTRADEIEEYRLGRSLILTTYGYTALQSPWAERYMHHFRDKSGPTPIKTGSLLLAETDARARRRARARLLPRDTDGRRVIVYATTLKARSSLRFQIHETLDEHLAGMRDMVAAVRAHADAQLVIKLHPGGALTEQYVRELVPEALCDRISLASKIPFAEVLAAADVLVSYSSTCIEEAIQNGVPVLLYDRWARYRHLPAVSLNRDQTPSMSAVYYVSEPAALDAALAWIVAHHGVGSLPRDTQRAHVYPPDAREGFFDFVARCLQPAAAHADCAAGTVVTRG